MNFIILIALCGVHCVISKDRNDTNGAEILNTPSFDDLAPENVPQRAVISYVSPDTNQYLFWNDTIFVDHELAEKFLKKFGHLIETLIIDYQFIPSEHHQKIGKFVSTHCSETLLEFHAKKCEEGAFNKMTKPFRRVGTVIFDGSWREKENNSLGFDELFPEMRSLNLTYHGTWSYMLKRNYPNLTELNIDIIFVRNFVSIFENNPQIETLRMKRTTLMFLQIFNKCLPNLRVLAFTASFDLPPYKGPAPAVTIDHVKDVSIIDTQKYMRHGRFEFKQMEKFELFEDGHVEDSWIEFIANSENLSTLLIPSGYLNDASLLKLSTKLHNLVEAKINCDLSVKIETIGQFVENNKKMEAITLNFDRDSEVFCNRLAERLSDEWTFTPLNDEYTGIYITTRDESNVISTETTSQISTISSTENQNQNASNQLCNSIIFITSLATIFKQILNRI